MPRYINPRRTWRYSDEFKVTAVQLSHRSDIQVQQVAMALDIHPFMLSRWRKELREGRLVADKRKKSPTTVTQKELNKIKQLEKQVAELQQENKLLKKWQRFLAEEHHNDTSSSRGTDKTSK